MYFDNDVVISGIGGIFPKAVDLEDFKELLLENVNTAEDSKWKKNYNEKNNMQEKRKEAFDATFFNIHESQAQYSDPMTRMFLEKTFEAVIDAGMNPSELRGKNIAVMIGSSLSEFDCFMYETIKSGFGLTDQARTMMANRISYWLNLNGPSFSTDANWSNGIQVIKNAIDLVKSGSCDGAIIGCANFPKYSNIQDGYTRTFDEKGDKNGYILADEYSRGNGAVVMFIQRADVAKRHYATLLHADLMFNGNRDGNYSEYNKQSFTNFLQENYRNSGINPNDVEYLETYGCGIKEVDELELDVVEEVFCKTREKPLKIGSVKTNTGHTESVSALMSLIKIIVAMETGIIPGHLSFDEPNANIPALKNKNIEIVTKNTKWNRGLAAINYMDLTSMYGHIIVQSNSKTKKSDVASNLPALLNFSTRTEEGIQKMIKNIKLQSNDEDYNNLVQEVFSKYIPGHIYRGYVLKGTKETTGYKSFSGNKLPIWFIYSGMESQWQTMGKDLMRLYIFAKAIKKCHKVLKPKGVDLIKIITEDDPNIFNNILNSFIGIAAIQIGLTDILKAIGITPDGIIGHSVGELGCAYADGCLTVEQTILSAYYRGKVLLDAEIIDGAMAAIGMSYSSLKSICPETIDIACHNSQENCIISGPTTEVQDFVNILKSKGILAKVVNASNISYHSRYIRSIAPYLMSNLKEVIPNPKGRSSKWISTSVPESDWYISLAKTASAEYLTNNLLSSVLFEEGLSHIPNNAIIIEIAPQGLLQAILKRAVAPEVVTIALTKRNTDCLEYLFNSLGQLFLSGLDLNLSVLYPPVPYPVTVGTRSLCKLIHWEHGNEWSALNERVNLNKEKHYEINLTANEYESLNKHKVDGQIIIPPALYFNLICEMIQQNENLKYVTFQNVIFKNQITTDPEAIVNITITMNEATGLFEVSHLNKVILSGQVIIDENYNVPSVEKEEKDQIYVINRDEFYTELNTRGYKYNNEYKCVESINIDHNGFSGKIRYNKNWDAVFSAMLQLHLYHSSDNNLEVLAPKFIQRLTLSFEKLNQVNNECTAEYDTRTGIFNSNVGINISGLSHAIVKRQSKLLLVENLVFMNYINDENLEDIQQGIDLFMKLVTENTFDDKLTITELKDKRINGYSENIKKYFQHSHEKVNYEIINELKDDTNLTIIYNETEVVETNNFVLLRLLQTEPSCFRNEFVVIAKFNYMNYSYYLLRKPSKNPLKIITVDNSSVWKQELIFESKCVTNTLKSKILIISTIIPEEGVDKFVENTQKIVPNNRNLRFLFILDSTMPDTSSDNIYYKYLLEKDLYVTILKNDNFGNYIRTTKKTESLDILVHNSIIAAATSNEFAKFCNANYLNMHLKDMTRSSEKNTPLEICAVDYVGTDSKTGRNIMGIAKPNLKEGTLMTDPDYVWEVPRNWNLYDAATVPYAYTLAYYTLFEVANITKGDSVLIHAGCTAFGQAALHVAYNYGCEVYTTVATDHQKHILKKLLPDILDGNIMSSEDSNFELQIMWQTKGRGVDVVLNCLPKDRLHASKRCLATFGRFLQLGVEDLKEYNSTGMNIFLKCTSFHAVSAEKLFQYDTEVKRKLHQLISKDIKSGIVKPIARKIFTENRIDHILSYLKSNSGAETAILKLHDMNSNILEENKKCIPKFDKDGVYLVYGDKRDSWLYLVEWLIKRGARKVLVAKQTFNHQNYINRYLSLLKRNYNAEILITQSNASNIVNARHLLTTANPFKTITEAFIFANYEEKCIDKHLLENIDNALKLENIDCRIVCFVGHSNNENNYVRSNSKICNIQWEGQYTIMDILKNMDSLLTKEDNLNISVKNEVVVSSDEKYSKDNSVFLPNNLKTLKQIGENATDNQILIPLTTRTPAKVKGLSPMFIIPGLSGIHCPNLQEFINQLIYPAYAINVHGVDLKENGAGKIAKFIAKSHQLETYNLIGVLWGGVLSIEIAKELEKLGKQINLQIIDGAPKTVQEFTNNFNKSDEHLLKQMLKINEQSLEKILNNSNELYKNDYNFIEKSLKVLRNLIEFSNFYKPCSNKIIGRTILLRPENCDEEDFCNMNEHCIEVSYKIMKGKQQNILQDKKFIEFVNDNHISL